MAKIFANSGDPDQIPHSAVSDLDLHCSQITLFRISRLKWVKIKYTDFKHSRYFTGWSLMSSKEHKLILLSGTGSCLEILRVNLSIRQN